MATKASEVIEIKPIEMAQTVIHVEGDSPLIMHAWSAKAKREILSKEIQSTKSKAREAKSPLEDFCASMYWLTPMPEQFDEESVTKALEGARFGFPAVAFKDAAIKAAYRNGWSKDQVSLRGAFFIEPDATGYYGGDLVVNYDKKTVDVVPNAYLSNSMVEIISDTPIMREDMVRVMNSAADIRYRGEFQHWSANLKLSYNKNGRYSLEQIINMINLGGMSNGIGEWRTEKGGDNGRFHVSA